MIKRLICAIFWVCLFWVAIPAPAAENPPGPPSQGSQEAGNQKSPQPQVEAPNTTGPIITDSALTQDKNTWEIQIIPTLGFVGGVFNSHWQRVSTGNNQANTVRDIPFPGNYKSLMLPTEIYYGITPRLEVSVIVPFVQNWATNVGPFSRAAAFGHLGDVSAQVRYRLLEGSPTSTTVTGYFSVLFPTGHASPLEPKFLSIDQTGSGAFSFTWGIDIYKYVPRGPILLYANIWYTNFAEGHVNQARVYYPDQVTVNLAMEIPFKNSPENRWAFLLEMLSLWDAGRMFGPRANQTPLAIVNLLPALEFLPSKRLTLAAGVQVPLIGRNTTFSYAPTLSLFISF